MPWMMLLMMHQPHLHQPWRLHRCHPFIYSLGGLEGPCWRRALAFMCGDSGAVRHAGLWFGEDAVVDWDPALAPWLRE